MGKLDCGAQGLKNTQKKQVKEIFFLRFAIDS